MSLSQSESAILHESLIFKKCNAIFTALVIKCVLALMLYKMYLNDFFMRRIKILLIPMIFYYRGTTLGINLLSLVGMLIFTFTLDLKLLWVVFLCAGLFG